MEKIGDFEFVINTEALKKVASIDIEFKLAQKLAIDIFNNVSNNTDQYKALCRRLRIACDRMVEDLKLVEAAIPAEEPR